MIILVTSSIKLQGRVVISYNTKFFLGLLVIKVNPASFLGELGIMKVKSAKMTFCRNRKISPKTEIFHLKYVKKNPKFSNLVL